MDYKDVKQILDIPNIENYLRTVFELDLYEVGDRTIIYKVKLPNRHSIVIDLNSDETLILGSQDLAEILTHYDISFFDWKEYNDLDEAVGAFMYRPLINESEKNY